MKNRLLLLLVLSFTVLMTPANAHDVNDGQNTTAEHSNSPSLHERVNQFLKSVPHNSSFVVSLESKTDNDLLVDVRAAESFQKAPLKDALNIPLTDLHDRINELPTDKKVFVVGESTVDGAYAVFVLRLHGVDGWLIKTSELPSGCPLKEDHKHQ